MNSHSYCKREEDGAAKGRKERKNRGLRTRKGEKRIDCKFIKAEGTTGGQAGGFIVKYKYMFRRKNGSVKKCGSRPCGTAQCSEVHQ